jgi:hypothetical protein
MDQDDLPSVAAGIPAGLVILKHRSEAPFDLADFMVNPERYTEDFDLLTRDADGDAWTVTEDESRVTTGFESEDLFIVRTTDGLDLDVVWGDVPLVAFLGEELKIEPDVDGCYSSLNTQLVNHDGTPAKGPNRLFYCPDQSVALFDAPDGYQIDLAATDAGDAFEEAEVSTSIRDNVRLYVKEIYPRNPNSRSTDSVTGNVTAGFRDAGQDASYAFQHLVTGANPENVHTGQSSYRPSPLTAVPLSLWALLKLRPGESLGTLFSGAASAVQVVADAASATNNAVINPVVQVSVGNLASPAAADSTGTWFGALQQSVAKNLPLGERMVDAVNPVAAFRHNRGFAPSGYTRTDTQLNIDRVMTVLDAIAINAVRSHNRSSSSSRRNAAPDGDGGSPPAGGAPPAPPVPVGGTGGGGTGGGGTAVGGTGGICPGGID